MKHLKVGRLLSISEVASLIGVTTRTIATYKQRGAIPYYQYGRVVRFNLEDVLAHIESHTLNRKAC